MVVEVPGQIDLFGGDVEQSEASPAPGRPIVKSGFGGKPDVVAEVLGEIRDGRYGRLDSNDRIVRIERGERCRYASDAEAEAVESLLAQRYAQLGAVVELRHGVIAKGVYRIRLTPGGRGLLERWFSLRIRKHP
ncbi:hypothetical protein [Lentzea albida]|uniref:hypothetical protein n=1 Tax=Lentzea albida TaxID=65499 RepID=UPI000B7CA00D|nr:hypothetical protein [Lentzea albida]